MSSNALNVRIRAQNYRDPETRERELPALG